MWFKLMVYYTIEYLEDVSIYWLCNISPTEGMSYIEGLTQTEGMSYIDGVTGVQLKVCNMSLAQGK